MCADPIRWTVDVRQFPTLLARREVRRFRQAMADWAAAAGVITLFKGRQSLRYDITTHQLLPADGSAPKNRHIYIGAIGEHVSSLMTGNVIGLAMPSRVVVSTRTIVTGVAIVRASFVRRESSNSPDLLLGLYLHELGHVFGLGHAVRPINAMYPTVREHTSLGPGDVRGVQRATQPCTTSSGTAVEPGIADVIPISPHDFKDSIIVLETQ